MQNHNEPSNEKIADGEEFPTEPTPIIVSPEEYEQLCRVMDEPAANEFLKRHAFDKQNAILSRTYVATEITTSGVGVVGYYTLTHASVLQSEAPIKCVSCGFLGLADHIAAIEIGSRASVIMPIVSSLAA